SSSPIKTFGVGGSANGNVVIMAGASSGTSISVSSIDTIGSGAGAVSSGGAVFLSTAKPIIATSVGMQAVIILGGNTYAQSGVVDAGSLQPGGISVNGITTNAAPVTLVAGGNITLNGAITTNGSAPNNGLGTQETVFPGN